ncbi:MAG: hypothetical protein E7D39_02005, partial [Bifidobacterium longum]|nr:hypothetical protein [Bifidobacterium longum]
AQHGELVLDQRMIQNMEFHDSQPSPSLPTCRIGTDNGVRENLAERCKTGNAKGVKPGINMVQNKG